MAWLTSAIADTVIYMNIIRTETHQSTPVNAAFGDRPDELPIAASVWDVSKSHGPNAKSLVPALYRAIVELETEVIALRERIEES